MLTVGLTGGIGAGKSTVAGLLVDHGAQLVDADTVAREVVVPGGPAYQPLIDRFGSEIVGPGGAIDRPTLAGMVFGHPEALADLNAITHPAIGVEMINRRDRFTGTGLALERLVTLRGMDPSDAEARIGSQIDRSARLEGADLVVDNSGDHAHLQAEVDRVWRVLTGLRDRS
jgi:dephospho-CoA kinase